MTQTPTRFTTPLLELITQQSMDADYEHVAAQRSAGAPTPQDPRHRGAWAIAIAFGVLIAVAAVQTGRNAGVASEGREQLISRIDARRQVVADQRSRIADLRSTIGVESADARTKSTELSRLEAQRDSVAADAGWLTVRGDGLQVTLNDNAATGDGGLVRDSDLALLADALWQGDATAIAVNGERLTALSAFRNSGDVIRINGVSLSPPYVVTALGEENRLTTALEISTAGRHLAGVVSQVGLGWTMENRKDLEVASARSGQLRLRYATTAGTSSASTTKGTQQ